MAQDTGVSSPPLTSRELPSWLPGPYCSLKTQLKHTPLDVASWAGCRSFLPGAGIVALLGFRFLLGRLAWVFTCACHYVHVPKKRGQRSSCLITSSPQSAWRCEFLWCEWRLAYVDLPEPTFQIDRLYAEFQ